MSNFAKRQKLLKDHIINKELLELWCMENLYKVLLLLL